MWNPRGTGGNNRRGRPFVAGDRGRGGSRGGRGRGARQEDSRGRSLSNPRTDSRQSITHPRSQSQHADSSTSRGGGQGNSSFAQHAKRSYEQANTDKSAGFKKPRNVRNPIPNAPRNISIADTSDMPAVNFMPEVTENIPKLIKDIRAEKSAVNLPKDLKAHPEFEQLANWKCDMTLKGCRCWSCRLLNSDHKLANNKIIFLSDQYFPAQVGEKAECVPVIRVEGGTFETAKQALLAQRSCGFRPGNGTLYVVGLTAHLCRIGAVLFWQQFDDFATWLKANMAGIAIPFLCPISKDLPDIFHLNYHQGLTILRARSIGDLDGAENWHYTLWKPLWEVLESESKTFDHPVPSVHITLPNGEIKTLICSSKVWRGVGGDFNNTTPAAIEKIFVKKLLSHIEKTVPPAQNVKIPPPHAVEGGHKLNGISQRKPSKARPTIYLYGDSIMKETATVLAKLLDQNPANLEIVMLGKKAKVLDSLQESPAPESLHADDVCVLHFIGNVSLQDARFRNLEDMWHYEKPEFLTDQDIHELVEVIVSVQRQVRKTFKGHIKIIGPFPRLLLKCCDDQSHILHPVTPLVSVIDYYDALNHYLAIHPKLKFFNSEFIPYNLIFEQGFDAGHLRDNIHLSESANEIFANFIFGLPSWARKFYKDLEYDHPAFYTWAATMRRTTTVHQAMIRQDPPRDPADDMDQI